MDSKISALIACLFAVQVTGLTTMPSVENGGIMTVVALENNLTLPSSVRLADRNNQIFPTSWFLVTTNTKVQIFSSNPLFSIRE